MELKGIKKVKKTVIDKIQTMPKLSDILLPTPQPPPLLGGKTDSIFSQLIKTNKSLANPNEELARIVAVWDAVMDEFKWEDCKFSSIIRDAQASVNGKYHDDIKEVAIAEEIEQRAERNGSNPSIGLKILE